MDDLRQLLARTDLQEAAIPAAVARAAAVVMSGSGYAAGREAINTMWEVRDGMHWKSGGRDSREDIVNFDIVPIAAAKPHRECFPDGMVKSKPQAKGMTEKSNWSYFAGRRTRNIDFRIRSLREIAGRVVRISPGPTPRPNRAGGRRHIARLAGSCTTS